MRIPGWILVLARDVSDWLIIWLLSKALKALILSRTMHIRDKF
jgi:hypothetical protein